MPSMKKVEGAQLLWPGNCTSCGSCDPERTYIDFGITEEFVGTVYCCHMCFEFIAKEMGYVSSILMQSMQDQVYAAERQLFEANLKIEVLKNAVAVLCSDPDSLLASLDDAVSHAVSNVEATNRLAKHDPRTYAADEVSDESGSGEGSNDASSASDDAGDGVVRDSGSELDPEVAELLADSD